MAYGAFFVALVVTSMSLWLLRPIAVNIGLVDHPGGHKIHRGEVPLIGGIAMFLGVVIALAVFRTIAGWGWFIAAAGLLLVAGAIDDMHELRVSTRMLTQLVAGLMMAFGADVTLVSLGDLIGMGNIALGVLVIPFTLFSVIGVINALNMSDGLDGLAGSLSLITVSLVALLVVLNGQADNLGLLVLFPAVLVPFLIVNLCRRPCNPVFMGDAGSTFLGFSLAWILIAYSQGEDAVFRPVTALWLIAVPLIDTVSLMIRRMLKGRSPFMPDRQHFHHVLLAAGLSPRQVLSAVIIIAAVLGLIGVAAEIALIPEWILATGFIVLGLLYLFAVQHAWRIKRALGKMLGGQ